MRKASRDKLEEKISPPPCIHGLVEIKSLVIALLLVATIILACERYTYIIPPSSSTLSLVKNSINFSSSKDQENDLNLALIRNYGVANVLIRDNSKGKSQGRENNNILSIGGNRDCSNASTNKITAFNEDAKAIIKDNLGDNQDFVKLNDKINHAYTGDNQAMVNLIDQSNHAFVGDNQAMVKIIHKDNPVFIGNSKENNSIPSEMTEGSIQEREEKVDHNVNVIKRNFRAFGSAASVFVEFGAYRGGDNSFAIVGLGSKPLHVYGQAGFKCEWEPAGGHSSGQRLVYGRADKLLPDWGYGRVYTVVVVNCSFQEGVGVDGQGGKLILHATSAGSDVVTFVALEETSESYAAASAEYKREQYTYDFMYCGSSLFGDINPQRMREWLAYHVRLMGPKSHFVFHDAGGVSPCVRQVLLKWQARGHVTLHDIREQDKYDGYYYNQFLIVNDCLHRTRFLAEWTFFFDVDEYLYVPPHTNLHDTMHSFSNYTQITFQQSPMSSKLCQATHNSSEKLWGFEKLVYRNVKRGARWDRKYAIQARNVYATGVHLSENIDGKTLHTKESSIKYYHYHNSITSKEADLCKEIVTASSTRGITYSDHDPFKIDLGMPYFAQAVKDFELEKIGPQPFIT